MKATQILHERGQSLWLDNLTRGLLDCGQLRHHIDTDAVTGLTSNPSIFDKAIQTGDDDDAIRDESGPGLSDEALFLELAIEDLRRAADAFLPVHERTDGVDGWVSLEVSPLLAHDTAATIDAAKALHARVARRNLLIKIPGTPEGLPAITECIASGVPVNVTLLFSADQYRAAADAYLAGVERRLERDLNPAIGSVASVFMSRWDAAVATRVPAELKDRLGLAVGLDTYRAYRQLMDSDRVQRLENSGGRVQRLLWASTSTKDPAAPDTLYVHGLAAPFTVNTMPEATLRAFYDHGEVGEPMPADGGDADATLARSRRAGVDLTELAAKLQADRGQAVRGRLERPAGKDRQAAHGAHLTRKRRRKVRCRPPPPRERPSWKALEQHHAEIGMPSSNVFAQAQALAFGRTGQEVRAKGTAPDVVARRVADPPLPQPEALSPGQSKEARTNMADEPLRDPGYYPYDAIDLAGVAEVWRRGSVIGSWLLDLTAEALLADPRLDQFAGRVADSGEGRWTSIAAIEEGVPATLLTAALSSRFASRGSALFADKVQSAQRLAFGGHLERKGSS